jgi:transcriptional regulator with XRE-family HTH domain
MYPNLKIQIFKSGIHQTRLAKEVGIADTVLSKIIHGYREPTEQQRKILAEYLRVDQGWLFERFDLIPDRGDSGTADPPQATPIATPGRGPNDGK